MLATAVLTPAKEGGFIAFNPETGTTTQGESIEEAVANMREAVELFLEEFPMKLLEGSGFEQVRQRGSHVVMRRASQACVVPLHKEVKWEHSQAFCARPN